MGALDNALGLELHVSLWHPYRVNKTVTKHVQKLSGTKNSGAWNSILLPTNLFSKIRRVRREAYEHRERLTLANIPGEPRIVRLEVYGELQTKLRALQNEFYVHVDDLSNAYPHYRELAREELEREGEWNMFIEKAYPPAFLFRDEFVFTVDFPALRRTNGLPAFLDQLARQDAEAIIRQREEAEQQRNDAATRELWQRLYGQIQPMAARLSSDKAKGLDVMVSHVSGLCSILKTINPGSDPALTEMIGRVESNLAGLDPASLRISRMVRTDAAQEAARLTREIESKGAFPALSYGKRKVRA